MTTMTRCTACGGPLAAYPTIVSRDRMHGVAGSWPVHVCVRCGSGVTLPLVAEQDLAEFYPRDYRPHELQRGVLASAMALVQRGRNRRFPLERLARGSRSAILLDVGCGRGDFAASLAEAGWTVLGIEPSAEAAAVARTRGAQVSVGTLSTVALEPESVDAAVFRHSLEHVVDPGHDLRRVYDSLRPGGRLAVIVPNWGSWQRRAFGEYWYPLDLPRHRTHFTAEGLRIALQRAGFERIEVRPGSPLITTTWSLQYRIFDRSLTNMGAALLAGYAVSVPVSLAVLAIDRLVGDGDFLHAAAVRPTPERARL